MIEHDTLDSNLVVIQERSGWQPGWRHFAPAEGFPGAEFANAIESLAPSKATCIATGLFVDPARQRHVWRKVGAAVLDQLRVSVLSRRGRFASPARPGPRSDAPCP
jgi:hypothetical protein